MEEFEFVKDDEEKKLHSRLEQQSSLICMLKQRLDSTLRDLNDNKQTCSAIRDQLEQVQRSLAVEMKHRQQLEDRFHILATNHEEMIKIKDDYKMEVRRLKKEVGGDAQKKVESEHQWAETLKARKQREEELEQKVREMAKEKGKAEQERTVALTRIVEAEQELKGCGEKQDASLLELAAVRDKYSAVCVEKVEKEKVLFGLQVRVQQLQLQLEEEQHLVQASEEKTAALQAEMVQLKAKYQEKEEKLNKDAAIVSLKEQLTDSMKAHISLQKEYDAYKIHSSELLTAEKKLNEQLRHLLD